MITDKQIQWLLPVYQEANAILDRIPDFDSSCRTHGIDANYFKDRMLVYCDFIYDGKTGFSYYVNAFSKNGKQRTGKLGFHTGDFSVQWENDYFGFSGGDKFRSNAIEFGIGDYFIGTNLYSLKDEGTNKLNVSQIWPYNSDGSYKAGERVSSPAYIGKYIGNKKLSVGWNHPLIGDFIQNGFHYMVHSFMRAPYHGSHPSNVSSPYFQIGYNKKNSLY